MPCGRIVPSIAMDVGFSFDNSSLFSRDLCRIGKSFWGGGKLTLDIRVVCLVGQKMEKLCRRR